MKTELKINVPKDWSAVTLRDYLKLRRDMETYKDNDSAITACLFHHLAHFPLEYLQQLDTNTYTSIRRDLISFFTNIQLPLRRVITIDGVRYGFEPNLSQIPYGAYLDISKYESLEINDKWAEVMSILYRPLEKESGALYDIQPYKAEINGEKFLDVAMDIHWGALFFFNDLWKDLLKNTQKSLMQELVEMDLPPMLKRILQENGKDIHHLYNWQEEMLPKSMRLP